MQARIFIVINFNEATCMYITSIYLEKFPSAQYVAIARRHSLRLLELLMINFL